MDGVRAAMAVMLVLQGASAQAGVAAPLAGIYSNVCMHPESGDLLGTELTFAGPADPGRVQLQRYEGAAVAPEQLRMTARGTAWYLHGGDGAAMMLLQRQGAALRVTYLDGQLSSGGGTSETLVVTAPGRADRQRPICR